jgi:hypothetical protein
VIQTIKHTLENAHKGWGKAVFDDSPPNFTVMPCLSIYTINRVPAASGDGKSLPFFHHWIAIDVWMKNTLKLQDRERVLKDVVLVLVGIENCELMIENIRHIKDTNNVHYVVEVYCVGGLEDDYRRN